MEYVGSCLNYDFFSQQTWRFHHHRNGDAANVAGSRVKDLSTLSFPRRHDFLLVGSRSDVPSLAPFLQETSLETRGVLVNQQQVMKTRWREVREETIPELFLLLVVLSLLF